MDDWPKCAVEGCERKTYSEGESAYCFPHYAGSKPIGQDRVTWLGPKDESRITSKSQDIQADKGEKS